MNGPLLRVQRPRGRRSCPERRTHTRTRANGRTDGRTDGRTRGREESIPKAATHEGEGERGRARGGESSGGGCCRERRTIGRTDEQSERRRKSCSNNCSPLSLPRRRRSSENRILRHLERRSEKSWERRSHCEAVRKGITAVRRAEIERRRRCSGQIDTFPSEEALQVATKCVVAAWEKSKETQCCSRKRERVTEHVLQHLRRLRSVGQRTTTKRGVKSDKSDNNGDDDIAVRRFSPLPLPLSPVCPICDKRETATVICSPCRPHQPRRSPQ